MWRKFLIVALLAVLAAPVLAFRSAVALTISPVLLEYDMSPGATVSSFVKLHNEGEDAETYYPVVQDFVAGDEAGTPSFVGMAETNSLVKWVEFSADSYDLGPGETAYASYTITVPSDASPGGYFGGLLFSTTKPTAQGGVVGVESMTGPLLLVRIAGEVVERGAITEFSVNPDSATSLPVDFALRFQNTGTVHVKPVGVVKITNMFGGTSAVIPINEMGGNVLPDSARVFSSTWQREELPENASEFVKEWKNFGFGQYTATVILNYGASDQVASATTSFWVMPWMLIVLAIVLIVIVVLLVQQYNRWLINKHMKGRK